MSSVLRPVRKRKKGRTLGPVDVIDRKEYAELDVDTKVELIRSLVPLGLTACRGVARRGGDGAGGRALCPQLDASGRRASSCAATPGRSGWPALRVPIRVPRIRHVAGSEMPLRSCEALHGERAVNDLLLKRVHVRNLVPQLRSRRGGDSRSHRAVGERPCPGALFRLARRNCGSSRSGTSPARTWWPWSWTARPLVSEATSWSSRWASRWRGNKRFLGFVETDTENGTKC